MKIVNTRRYHTLTTAAGSVALIRTYRTPAGDTITEQTKYYSSLDAAVREGGLYVASPGRDSDRLMVVTEVAR